MNRIGKRVVIAVTVLVLLAVAASVVVSVMVDEEKLKTTLLERVNSRLNGTLAINGEMHIALWPSLSVKATDLHLQSPPGAAQDFASAREIRIGVALLPLLHQEVRANEIALDGLVVNAARDGSGKGNWESLLTSVGEQAKVAPGQTASDSGQVAKGAPLFLHMDELRLTDATIRLDDIAAGTHHEIGKLDIRGDGVNFDGKPFHLAGSASVKTAADKPALDIDIDSTLAHDGDSGVITLTDAKIGVGALLGQTARLEAASGTVSPRAATADLPAFRLAFAGWSIDGSLAANWGAAGAMHLSGNLGTKDVNVIDLLTLMTVAVPEGINPDALKRVSLGGDYSLRGTDLTLSRFGLQLGTFKGEIGASIDLAGRTLHNASLSSADLDLDYLFPPKPGDEAKKAQDPEAESAALSSLLDVEGEFDARIGRLHNATWDLQDVSAHFALEKKHARLERLAAKLYGGTLNADVTIDARKEPGAMRANMRLTEVDLQPLLVAAQKIDNLEGRINTSVELSGSGLNGKSWVKTLAGPVQVHVDKPVLRDISLDEVICQSAAKLNHEKPTRNFPAYTQLNSIDTTMDFSDGNGVFRNLSLLMPNIAIDGKGNVNLAERNLAIKLNARITQDLGSLDPACRTPKKMMEIDWPVTCKGSFNDNPGKLCGIAPADMAAIATQLAKGRLENTLKKGLGKFFGQ